MASMYGAVPFNVKVSTGKLEPKSTASSRLVLRIHRILVLLKIIQLSISLARLLISAQQSSTSVWKAVVVAMALCGSVTGLIWNLDLEKHVVNIVVLLRPLQLVSQSGMVETSDVIKLNQSKEKYFKKVINYLVRQYNRVLSYLKSLHNDFVRCQPSFSIYEMLTVSVPLVLMFLFSAIQVCAIIGEPEDVLTLSLLNPELKRKGVLRAATVLLDVVVLSFHAWTCQVALFAICAVLAIHTADLKRLERFIDRQGIQSSRNMRYVWQEIRRLTTALNLLNMFSNSFYMGKLYAFTCSILGSSAILRFGIQHLMSLTLGFIALEAIMFYVLCFGNAYVIKDMMNNVLQKIKYRSHSPFIGICRRELKQRVKSVRAMAFQEAGFRAMSRGTTPEFVDFYVNQVIALVLTF